MLFTIISLLASKCITLKMLYCMHIEFMTCIANSQMFAQMHFEVDINLHSYYIMLQYYANRLTGQKLFKLIQLIAFCC